MRIMFAYIIDRLIRRLRQGWQIAIWHAKIYTILALLSVGPRNIGHNASRPTVCSSTFNEFRATSLLIALQALLRRSRIKELRPALADTLLSIAHDVVGPTPHTALRLVLRAQRDAKIDAQVIQIFFEQRHILVSPRGCKLRTHFRHDVRDPFARVWQHDDTLHRAADRALAAMDDCFALCASLGFVHCLDTT